MAGKNDSGEKTEQPTPKRLRDARKKGDVPKSKDATAAVGLLVWVALFGLALPWVGGRLVALAQSCMQVATGLRAGEPAALVSLTLQGGRTLLEVSLAALLPAVLVGVAVEYLQAGPVFATDKLSPKASSLNPVEGFKRMFSLDNLIEVGKNLAKIALVAVLVYRGMRSEAGQWLRLAQAEHGGLLAAQLQHAFRDALVAVTVAFLLIAGLDMAWQRFRYLKKMRMSLRDIRQEVKDAEGDPIIKGQRKQMHQEWSQQGAAQAARGATALVVNPTHLAIAIQYDRVVCPVPVVSALGEEDTARAMREAAAEAGVPVLRNRRLARTLWSGSKVGEAVPVELFDVVAELVLWARECREEIERQRADPWSPPRPLRAPPPGRDFTVYRAGDPLPADDDEDTEDDAQDASADPAGQAHEAQRR